MSSVDENITHCLEQIDSTFVKAIDVVASISKSVKSISSNMREMEMHSRKWITLFDLCGLSNSSDPEIRQSIGNTMAVDSEVFPLYLPGTDTEEIPSFLIDETTGNLKCMSPPRTTTVFLPLVTPGGDCDTSAMDTSSSIDGYSPPHTPVLKRRKPSLLLRTSMGLELSNPPLPSSLNESILDPINSNTNENPNANAN